MPLRFRTPKLRGNYLFTTAGLLWLRGPNIFEGYLKLQSDREFLRNGWLKTATSAAWTKKAFLYIEGRLSRFSRLAAKWCHTNYRQRIIAPRLWKKRAPIDYLRVARRSRRGAASVNRRSHRDVYKLRAAWN